MQDFSFKNHAKVALMPVLVYQYAPKEAVPLMAVAAVMTDLDGIMLVAGIAMLANAL